MSLVPCDQPIAMIASVALIIFFASFFFRSHENKRKIWLLCSTHCSWSNTCQICLLSDVLKLNRQRLERFLIMGSASISAKSHSVQFHNIFGDYWAKSHSVQFHHIFGVYWNWFSRLERSTLSRCLLTSLRSHSCVGALGPSFTAELELDRLVPCTASDRSLSFKTICGRVTEAARLGLVLVIHGLSRPKRSIEWLNALMEMERCRRNHFVHRLREAFRSYRFPDYCDLLKKLRSWRSNFVERCLDSPCLVWC